MDEEKRAGITKALATWMKGLLTSVVGLVSGAVLMYLTPYVNNTIKPAKPVANFAAQAAGLTVTFNNRSSGGVQGWWDFGDGSALEPYSAQQNIVTHTYDKPGSYSVKLALTNVINDESDRTVTINVDGTGSVTKPEIESFELTPVTPGDRTPAVYRLQSKIKNAAFFILASGDEKPLQLDAAAGSLERYLTFDEMGSYTIRLAALSGKDIVEKSKTIYVSPGADSDPTAKLRVSYEAVRLERSERKFMIHCGWHQSKESTSPIHAERLASPGYEFVEVQIVNKDEKDAPVRNLKCTIEADKTRFSLTGDLVKASGWLGSKGTPHWRAEVKAVMERRSAPATINSGEVAMAVPINQTVKIPWQPLEPGVEPIRKQLALELWEGTRKVWESDKAGASGMQGVVNAKVTLKNQVCYITTTPQKDGMTVRLDGPAGPTTRVSAPPATPAAVPSVVRPASFERLPFLPRPKSE